MRKRYSFMLMMIFAVLIFAGCVNGEENNVNDTTSEASEEAVTSVENDDEIVIGITQNNVGTDSYQTTYDQAFRDEAEAQGIKAIILDARGDPMTQTNQVEDLIQQEVDVIIVWPVDGSAIVPATQTAYEAGIPVLVTNSNIAESGFDFVKGFSGPDNITQGQYAGEMLMEALNGEGKIVEIMGLPGYSTAIERSEGFHNVLEEYPNIELLDTQPGDWNRETAQQVMENFLTRFPEIDGLYAADDNLAVGALNALREVGREGEIFITSATQFGDGWDAMIDGEIYGSVVQSPVEDAINAFNTAILIAEGEEIEFFNYFNTPKITEENMDEFERPVF